jgi:hypothetical protein
MRKRAVVLTGSARWYWLTVSTANLENYLRMAFQKAGWDVLSITAVSPTWLSQQVNLTFKFNVFEEFSAENVRQRATNLLNNFNENSISGNGITEQVFGNVSLRVTSDARVYAPTVTKSPVITQRSKTPVKTNPKITKPNNPSPIITQRSKTPVKTNPKITKPNNPSPIDVGVVAAVNVPWGDDPEPDFIDKLASFLNVSKPTVYVGGGLIAILLIKHFKDS